MCDATEDQHICLFVWLKNKKDAQAFSVNQKPL